MATWTDGPEYAPSQRPTAFVAPTAEALASPPEPRLIEPELPTIEPSFSPPTQPTPDLRELVPSAAPGRNPNLPFESMTTPIAAGPTAPAQRAPEEPFNAPGPSLTGYQAVEPVVEPSAQLNPLPFSTPGSPQWAAPSPDQLVRNPNGVSFAQIWQATTGWVLIPLIIGMFIVPIAPVALLVAGLSTTQIKYRRVAVRRAYVIALILISGISFVSVLNDQTLSIWDPLSFTSLISCWLLALITPGIVGAALRNGEPPDRL